MCQTTRQLYLWRIKIRGLRICLVLILRWYHLQRVRSMLDWHLRFPLFSHLRMERRFWIKVIWLMLGLLRGDKLLRISIRKLWIQLKLKNISWNYRLVKNKFFKTIHPNKSTKVFCTIKWADNSKTWQPLQAMTFLMAFKAQSRSNLTLNMSVLHLCPKSTSRCPL